MITPLDLQRYVRKRYQPRYGPPLALEDVEDASQIALLHWIEIGRPPIEIGPLSRVAYNALRRQWTRQGRYGVLSRPVVSPPSPSTDENERLHLALGSAANGRDVHRPDQMHTVLEKYLTGVSLPELERVGGVTEWVVWRAVQRLRSAWDVLALDAKPSLTVSLAVQCMVWLSLHGPSPVGEVAAALGADPSGMGTLYKRLHRQDLVAKQNRRSPITLTAAGHQHAEPLCLHMRWLAGLGWMKFDANVHQPLQALCRP